MTVACGASRVGSDPDAEQDGVEGEQSHPAMPVLKSMRGELGATIAANDWSDAPALLNRNCRWRSICDSAVAPTS
jgi:hypothetical protein